MRIIIITLVLFALSFSAAAQNAQSADSSKTAEAVLRVELIDGKSVEFKKSDLTKLPRRDVKAKTHDGKETTFSGFDLREVLKLAGVKFGEDGKKTNLNSYLIVEAADKYRAVFAMLELEPDFTDKIVLLADTRDGKPLSKEEGNFRLVVPDEKKQARSVRQVIRLIVRTINSATDLKVGINKSDEDMIQELVFAVLLKPYILNPDKTLKAYYLSVDNGKDPSDKLMKSFASYKVSVKKSSESFISEDEGSIVLDNKTKEQGILISISKIDWINPDEVKLTAGNYIGNVGSDDCVYILKRESGKWKILSKDQCVIS